MSTLIITRAKRSTNILAILLLAMSGYATRARAEWTVDFSRRQTETRTQDLRAPASSGEMPVAAPEYATPTPAAESEKAWAPAPTQPGFFESLFQSGEIAQEIVVLNTDKGFVPSSLRVRKGLNYKIHVVNVNEKEKNVSFVLDSFSEHHATYYGKIKTFVIRPQKEGVYRFISPETSAQGKLVVIPSGGVENRLPASASVTPEN